MLKKVSQAWKFCASSPSMPKWLLWGAVNLVIAGYMTYGLVAPASSMKSAWLPGETTHGHYQIELDCNACHDPASASDGADASDVMQDACIRCHGQQLKDSNDTHPAKKFNDPTNAARLAILDAQDCLTCHREHVPEQTLTMGLTVPQDYCWHCHQEVAESRPSHAGMAYDSCATAGCHNYHDNRAIYEKYLDNHFGEPDFLELASVMPREPHAYWRGQKDAAPLDLTGADGPQEAMADRKLMADWEETAHAAAGVNCSGCHGPSNDISEWTNTVALSTCQQCHESEAETFLQGKHGMRLAAGMSPMTPQQARLPMHVGAHHRELTCSACHDGHRFDTKYAAAEACLKCHADDHSMAYVDSSHAQLWLNELDGSGEVGSGVSCATCHMPRVDVDGVVHVQHDQSSNLRPNEKMAREVCTQCHGLEYSLSSLADSSAKQHCYSQAPEERTESVQMAHDWFVEQEAKRARRQSKRTKSDSSVSNQAGDGSE
ncbi:MAG: cytochrome c3 family protein [Planctomycetota bacterium]